MNYKDLKSWLGPVMCAASVASLASLMNLTGCFLPTGGGGGSGTGTSTGTNVGTGYGTGTLTEYSCGCGTCVDSSQNQTCPTATVCASSQQNATTQCSGFCQMRIMNGVTCTAPQGAQNTGVSCTGNNQVTTGSDVCMP
jgi:hypothetical protein